MEMVQLRTILVVDDTRSVLSLVTAILKTGNHNSLSASSYQEALDIAEQSANLDALITDIRMPGMSGFDLARAIRLARPGLPILFISGHFDSNSDEHLGWLRESQTAFLPKPFSPASLLKNIDGLFAAS